MLWRENMLRMFLSCWYLRLDSRVFRLFCLPPSGLEPSCILGRVIARQCSYIQIHPSSRWTPATLWFRWLEGRTVIPPLLHSYRVKPPPFTSNLIHPVRPMALSRFRAMIPTTMPSKKTQEEQDPISISKQAVLEIHINSAYSPPDSPPDQCLYIYLISGFLISQIYYPPPVTHTQRKRWHKEIRNISSRHNQTMHAIEGAFWV